MDTHNILSIPPSPRGTQGVPSNTKVNTLMNNENYKKCKCQRNDYCKEYELFGLLVIEYTLGEYKYIFV